MRGDQNAFYGCFPDIQCLASFLQNTPIAISVVDVGIWVAIGAVVVGAIIIFLGDW